MVLSLVFLLLSAQESSASVYLGGDIGYSRVETAVFTEADKNGIQISPQMLISLPLNNWNFDLGTGWIWNRSTGSEGVIREDTITSRGILLMAATRYSLGAHQAGLVSQSAFADNFNYGGNSPSTSVATFLGPQYLYHWKAWNIHWRVGASALLDLSVPQRHIFLALAHLQIGLPFSFFRSSHDEDSDEDAPLPPTPSTTSLELGRKSFKFMRDDLSPSAIRSLKKMAQFLASNSQEWNEVHFHGHSDERGKRSINLDLSRRRAEAARRVFLEAGIPSARMQAFAYGPDRPIDPRSEEEAWSKNRRVEVEVVGPLSDAFAKKLHALIADQSNL